MTNFFYSLQEAFQGLKQTRFSSRVAISTIAFLLVVHSLEGIVLLNGIQLTGMGND